MGPLGAEQLLFWLHQGGVDNAKIEPMPEKGEDLRFVDIVADELSLAGVLNVINDPYFSVRYTLHPVQTGSASRVTIEDRLAR